MRSHNNVSSVQDHVLGKAISRLKSVVLEYSPITPSQILTIFTMFAERKLRNLKLGLGHTDLSSISPDVLADALVGLDNIRLDLKDTKLTPHQAQSIFHKMASCENLALKSIDVGNNNFSSVPADVLVEAIFRLESVGLNNTHLTPVQINAIFKRISSRKLKKKIVRSSP